MARASLSLFSAALLLLADAAWAGPPFVTDDPEPVDVGHWEFNNAITGTWTSGETTAALPVIDANYGAAENLQLHLQPTYGYDRSAQGRHLGIADTELGVKYRFVQEGDDDDPTPMVAVYPLIELPTGSAADNLGMGHVRAFLPIWLQTSVGSWTHYGGGGYWINPGRGHQNSWFLGVSSNDQITDDWQLGGEIFDQSAMTPGGRAAPGFNLGGTYGVTDNIHLLFSAGRGLANIDATNQFSAYFAIQLTD